MQTPAQAARRRDDSGARLPMPWAGAAEKGAYLRRGQLAMLVAAPGVGKSVITTSYVANARHDDGQPLHSLYLSMDTDAYTTSIRLISAITGRTLEQAEQDKLLHPEWVEQVLGGVDGPRFAFPSSPNEREIADRLHAYREAEGLFPDLMVIDNLQDVAFDDEEFAGYRRVMRELRVVGSRTGTAILVLHHATGENENGDKPIGLSGIAGKVSKSPTMIWTAHRQGTGEVLVSIVKNRFGPANPAGGGVAFALAVDMAKTQVGDVSPTNWKVHGEQ